MRNLYVSKYQRVQDNEDKEKLKKKLGIREVQDIR